MDSRGPLPFARPASIAETQARLGRRDVGLPPIPGVAAALLRLLGRDDVGVAEVSATIADDAVIAAEVLRAANSAGQGVHGEVVNLLHATTLLGLDRVRAIAATVGLRRYLGVTLLRPAVRRCWTHNLACALIGEHLALRLGGVPADAYTAGLLHDLGRLGLVVAHPESYPRLLDHLRGPAEAVLDHERALLGLDHCEAGAWLGRQLALPQAFQDVARHHHDDDAPAGPGEVVLRARVACRLADWMDCWVIRPERPAETPAERADALAALAATLPPALGLVVLEAADDIAADVRERLDTFDAAALA